MPNKQGIKLCSEYKKYNKRHNVKALNSIPWCLCVVLALKNCVHKKSPTEVIAFWWEILALLNNFKDLF